MLAGTARHRAGAFASRIRWRNEAARSGLVLASLLKLETAVAAAPPARRRARWPRRPRRAGPPPRWSALGAGRRRRRRRGRRRSRLRRRRGGRPSLVPVPARRPAARCARALRRGRRGAGRVPRVRRLRGRSTRPAGRRGPFRLGVRADALLLYESLSHLSSDDPEPVRRGRLVPGATALAEARWSLSPSVALFAAADRRWHSEPQSPRGPGRGRQAGAPPSDRPGGADRGFLSSSCLPGG